MDETFESYIQNRLALFTEWETSVEYKNHCSLLSAAAANLLRIGEHYISCCVELRSNTVVRTEIATDSGMHRGFYCPSLIEDIVVGNAHRGRLLKRLSPKRKWYFVYGFDRDNRLILSQMFYNGKLSQEEYLVYDGDRVYGITQDSEGRLIHVASETYLRGKIMCYERAEITPWGGKCNYMCREEYIYATDRLEVCHSHEFRPKCQDETGIFEKFLFNNDSDAIGAYLKDNLARDSYRKSRYTFAWNEDCMTGYLAEDIIGANDEIVTCSHFYNIKPKENP